MDYFHAIASASESANARATGTMMTTDQTDQFLKLLYDNYSTTTTTTATTTTTTTTTTMTAASSGSLFLLTTKPHQRKNKTNKQ